ncbi:ABC transporter permease subunit [Nocardia sp. R6R-6]|uniref:ABC transporter permease subunit n=1 Tax=Nocardia sp. R6R-6 TaxID=3459303 RepID=UPI00403D5A43
MNDGTITDNRGTAARAANIFRGPLARLELARERPPTARTIHQKYGLLFLLIAVVVFFAVEPSTRALFISMPNIKDLLGAQSIVIVLAMASMFPLLAGRFDFSVTYNAALCSMVSGVVVGNHGGDLILAVIVALVVGAVVGLVNGLLIAYLNLSSSVLVTYGSAMIIYSIMLIISPDMSTPPTEFVTPSWIGVPLFVFMTAAVCLGGWWLVQHTPFGRNLAMSGGNSTADRSIGINVKPLTLATFGLAGVLSGIAGTLMLAGAGGENPQSPVDLLWAALIAVFVGATAIRPGEFNVVGTVLAALFLAVVVNGLRSWGLSPFVEPLVYGMALLVALWSYVFSHRGDTPTSVALDM